MAEDIKNTETKPGEVHLSVADRRAVCNRHQYLQGSWNYERMQNGGWCYAMIPAIKKLYPKKEDQIEALKRHLEFYNTHPYVSAPVIGVTLAMEEERANGAPIDDQAIQGVKVGMMGPLAGVGDPVFWFTVRPILGALGASLALGGSIVGPLLFFIAWNVIRLAFLWYSQEFGYKVGTDISKDLSGGLLGKVTEGASILGMFIIGALVQRWSPSASRRWSPTSRSTPRPTSTGTSSPLATRASSPRSTSTLTRACLSPRPRSPRCSRTSTRSFRALLPSV